MQCSTHEFSLLPANQTVFATRGKITESHIHVKQIWIISQLVELQKAAWGQMLCDFRGQHCIHISINELGDDPEIQAPPAWIYPYQ